MKCFICNKGETIYGTTSVLLERGELSLTIHNVPARICSTCGEAYADETVTASLLYEAEKIAEAGTKIWVHEYSLAGD